MDQNMFVERVIEGLTGVKLSIFRQNVTPKPSVEDRNPAKKVVAGLNFPGDPELARKWGKFLEKENLSFSLAEPLIFEFARWWKATQK